MKFDIHHFDNLSLNFRHGSSSINPARDYIARLTFLQSERHLQSVWLTRVKMAAQRSNEFICPRNPSRKDLRDALWSQQRFRGITFLTRLHSSRFEAPRPRLLEASFFTSYRWFTREGKREKRHTLLSNRDARVWVRTRYSIHIQGLCHVSTRAMDLCVYRTHRIIPPMKNY